MTSPNLRRIKTGLANQFPKEVTTRVHGMTWRSDGFPVMQSVLGEGDRGDVAISHFRINTEAAASFNLGCAMYAGGARDMVKPGEYVRMHIGERCVQNLMMSDTPMERRSNWGIKHHAHGRVLIAGLGIGMILHPLLRPDRTARSKNRYRIGEALPAVDHVTVVEYNPNVIALVAPSLARYGDRITIVQDDIHNFNPREKFDTAYFDIWPHIDGKNLPEIAALHQRWKSRLNRGGPVAPWMSSWMVDTLRAERAELTRTGW